MTIPSHKQGKWERRKKWHKIEVIGRENRVINVVAITLSEWTTDTTDIFVPLFVSIFLFFKLCFHLPSQTHISLAFYQMSVKRSNRNAFHVVRDSKRMRESGKKRARKMRTETAPSVQSLLLLSVCLGIGNI
jgi:hypothetical protein